MAAVHEGSFFVEKKEFLAGLSSVLATDEAATADPIVTRLVLIVRCCSRRGASH